MSWLAIEDHVYIVTGGASGIGKAITESLIHAGAIVAVLDISLETGNAAENGILDVKTDVTNGDSVRSSVDHVVATLGRLDGLVNNAGINIPRLLVDTKEPNSKFELNEQSFDLLFQINVKGAFFAAQNVARHLTTSGTGVIVNISSEAGVEGSEGQSAYSATKGAINSFTRSWGKELGKHGVRVVGVAPGINEPTGLTTPAYNEALAYTRGTTADKLNTDYSKVIPLGKPGTLKDIADLVTYLVSDRASYVTGTTYAVTGGKSRG